MGEKYLINSTKEVCDVNINVKLILVTDSWEIEEIATLADLLDARQRERQRFSVSALGKSPCPTFTDAQIAHGSIVVILKLFYSFNELINLAVMLCLID